ncbi:MAG: 30S ribosomal protein S15 [Verrucomicrobiae bacterium]|nr:30S ribosomal protein S15 [Verrucomicrobiae bacterium]
MSKTTKIDKKPIIEKFRKSDSDTGSSEVQIALLTARISQLTDHLRVHRKDYHSRRGLIALASRRRKLLDYVKRHDLNKYKQLLDELELRR